MDQSQAEENTGLKYSQEQSGNGRRGESELKRQGQGKPDTATHRKGTIKVK